MIDLANKVLSVTEYTRIIKGVLEKEMPHNWIRGEVSNLRHQASGHIYFTLKDEGSQLSCVMFKGDAMRQSVAISEGQQLLIFGEINVYEPRGNYQMIVRLVMLDGQGKLQMAFEALKKKLSEEGLFDKAKKREIPLLPKTIGFVTSATGAAVQDFISILKRRRWKGRLIVLPAKVQGDGASTEIIAQIKRAEALGIFDLLVIGRGGGSLEDLWAFNEEPLVRAVAACKIPLISAVGHEIDFALTDFAADLRAETPSGAAEVISSGYLDSVAYMESLAHRLDAVSPKALLEKAALRLDDLFNRLINALQSKLYESRQLMSDLQGRFLVQSPENKIKLAKQYIEQLEKRLVSASVDSTLKRGYVLIKKEDGTFAKLKQSLSTNDKLTARFSDGEIAVRVEK